jgi:hypothetical protein
LRRAWRCVLAPLRHSALTRHRLSLLLLAAQAQEAFGDCLYSPRDVAGFALGFASIGALCALRAVRCARCAR